VTYRPLVAVIGYHLDGGRVARWPEGGYGVPAPYLDALRRAGARTAMIAPGEPGKPEELLDPFDGLLLVGGGDVDPTRYGGPTDSEHLYGIELDRDEMEIAFLHAAERLRIPTLCICRGMQVMNVAYDGTLLQHLPDHADLIVHGVPMDDTYSMHEVRPEPHSYLSAMTKSGALACASHHHQGVDRVGDRVRVSGRSPDGLVEAIELRVDAAADPYLEPWMVGVQWHPEETAPTDPAQQSLFDGLVLLARVRGSKAKTGETEGRTRPYAIVDPDPSWPGRFEAEARRIGAALPTGLVTRIEHVGSTSVPGLSAKPIVDIQVSVAAMEPREAYVAPIVALGYQWALDPIEDEHEYFSLNRGGEDAFHIHVCAAGSEWERRHLAFRDWLRSHPEDAAAYERLKRDLAETHPRDVFSYVDGKSDFIQSVERRALASDDAAPVSARQ
jgi:putative glutamine amidotransferase